MNTKTKLVFIGAGCFCMMLISGVMNNSTTHFTASVTEYLGCSVTEFSTYFTIVTICAAVMSLIVGPFAKKLGVRKSALITLIGGCAGFFILSRLTALWQVYLAAVCIGLSQSFVVVPTVSVINAWFGDKAGSVIGLSMSATGVGGLIMGSVMPGTVAAIGWRKGYLVVCAIWAVICIMIMVLAGDKLPETGMVQTEKQKGKFEGVGDLIKNPEFIGILICCIFSGGAGMVMQHMSSILTTNGMSVAMVSAILSAMSLCLAIAKIVIGIFADKVPTYIYYPAFALAGTIGYFALSMKGTAILIVGILGYAFSAGSCTVLYPVVLRTLYGRQKASDAWGTCWGMFMIGQAICNTIYGLSKDYFGTYNISLYIISAAYLLIALFTFTRLIKHKNDLSKN